MKIQTKYICSKCGEEFDTESECLEHEHSHPIPVGFDDGIYDQKAMPLPDKLHVLFDDGTIAKYEFASIFVKGDKFKKKKENDENEN